MCQFETNTNSCMHCDAECIDCFSVLVGSVMVTRPPPDASELRTLPFDGKIFLGNQMLC